MSVPPDYMYGLDGSLNNSLYNPLMGIAAGLLQAAGPSRMPTSLGQALGAGLQTGQQFQQQGLQNAMQQLMLGQNIQGLQAMQQAGKGDAPIPPAFQAFVPQGQSTTPQQAPMPRAATTPMQLPAAVGTAASASNGLSAPAQAPPIGQPQAQQNAPQPQIPAWLQQVASDTQRLRVLEANPWNPNAAKAAADLRAQMGAEWNQLPSNMVKQFTGAPPLPGYGYQINELGEVKPYGESIYATGTAPGPSGVQQTFIANKATGGVTFPGNNASQRTPGTPLSNPADESYAQGLAEYKYKPPSVGTRNSVQAINWLARAQELNPAYDENAFDAKHAAYLSMAAGKDYNTNSAYSTIQTHLQTAQQAFDALNNGDIQSANKLTQWAGKQFGKSAPQNAKVVNDIVVGELAKVLAQGGQVTDSVRNEAAGDLEPYLSKGQYQGAVQYIQQLIAGKMATSHLNAQASKIPDDVWLAHLSPEAKQQLQIFEATHQGQPSGGTDVKSMSNADLLKALGMGGPSG